VRSQLKQRKGGTDDARLIAVVTMTKDQEGRRYRLPVTEDLVVVEGEKKALIIWKKMLLMMQSPLFLMKFSL